MFITLIFLKILIATFTVLAVLVVPDTLVCQ